MSVLGLWRGLIYQYREENVSVRYFINEIWTENIEDMVTIGLFLLLDKEFNSQRDEIRWYLETRHRVDGGYRIKQDEILLAVMKQAGGTQKTGPGHLSVPDPVKELLKDGYGLSCYITTRQGRR